MANYREDIVNIDLENGNIHRTYLKHSIGYGDNNANKFGVRVFRNGEAETLLGSCYGLFIRADGATITVNTGAVSGNLALVTLPEACYAVEGVFTLAIKVTAEEDVTTLRIVDGMVDRTSTDVIVDPGTILPTIDDLIEAINEAVESIPPDYSELSGSVDSMAMEQDLAWLAYKNDGKYINSSNVETTSELLSHTDYILIPQNVVAVECGNLINQYHITPNILFYGENKNLLVVRSSTEDIAVYSIPSEAKYIRVNQPISTATTKQAVIRFVYEDVYGNKGQNTLNFTEAGQTKNTTVKVYAGVPYTIVCNSDIETGHVNAYALGDTTLYAAIYKKGSVQFTPAVTAYLSLANIDGFTGNIDIEVYETSKLLSKMRRVPAVYEVGFEKKCKSLTEMLLALKGDNSEKIIYVDGGDYDIFQEYTDLGLLDGEPPADPTFDYWDYNVVIPENTHIIGRGIVRLLWQPTTSQISEAWSKTISAVNVAGSMTLENVEIHVTNGRYCIHDDTLGKAEYRGAIKKYINVRCYKYANDAGYGFAPVIGFGLDTRDNYNFENCLFKHLAGNAAFYVHNRAVVLNARRNSPTVTVKNCIMDTTGGSGVRLGNVSGNPSLRIRIMFIGCHIGGYFRVGDENDISQGNNPNTFDITLLRCNDVNIQIASDTNPYPPTVYG